MSNFAWFSTATHSGPAWSLWLCYLSDRPGVRIGTLTKQSRGWHVYDPSEREAVVLDNHLSLDEAQRAAKLLLCVGRTS